ncbi:hypothetical protein [Levilactobacillus andaensis]|uniref:hypothetical protein n=1 Tax=Levilactobacillus andaensis TaxID=2799570 RepID=UPI001944926F|nr:hypothetical protein [Levilactobacillus andaensis]
MMALEQTELFEKSNDKEVIKCVKRFFNHYFMRLVLKSGKSLASLQSPKYDGMPKAPGVSSDRDRELVEAADYQEVVECVLEAFQNMAGISSGIVWHSLVMHESNKHVEDIVHYEHSRFSDRKKAAIIEFYYAFTGRLARRGLQRDDLKFDEYLYRKKSDF